MDSVTDWEWFIKKFEVMSNINLTAYKRPQMERRINSFMRTVNIANYQDFIKILGSDKEIYRRFLEHITINVSEFFRNLNHWDVMEKQIIPPLLKERGSLKIWSAGCSTGEEPYSLAMLFQERKINLSDKILATDIDKDVLEKAGIGLYTAKAMNGVPGEWQSKYFNKQGNYYQINDEMKKMIKFQQHDLLRDSFPKEYDLILCRNVVIYFTEETKAKLYKRFSDSLRTRGVLFIGSTEQIFQARDVGLKSIATFFYQKD
ncbi:MAG: protein-glutamate O-methyltransferase CheR [Syntrophomonadaceae bacterium]|nr:protein-glutamate O-methyltransferase CheR [Syntrophomonadaceae bacterium]